jgi:SAM-dependent methyltransferase
MTVYHDVANSDLLDRIPLSARTVLDVGCGRGGLGLALRPLNPNVRLLGIEQHPEAAATAATRYDAVAQVDVEAEPLPFGDETYDCLIYGDILEHLRDPWAVVAQQITRLSDHGVVLICAPNVEHWSFVARLLQGTFAYEPTGLFDITHLRWFSLSNTRTAIDGLGLYPVDVHPRVFDAERAARFVDTLGATLAALGVAKQNYGSRASALQYVWRVLKQPRPRLTVAATMLKPVGGVSDLRIMLPQYALASEPAVTAVIGNLNSVEAPKDDSPHILLLHRPILKGEAGLAALRQRLAEGWVIVTEFDDHPDFFPALRGDDNWTFAGVHALQTSTESLAETLRQLNPNVAVFPNALRSLQTPANYSAPDHVTLFFGALNRGADWQPYMDTLNEVAALSEGRLRFSVVHDQAFFDALRTPHKRFTPTCDYATYMQLLSECEISFMPLNDSVFNRAKSDLKFIEAGACRVAALASPTVYAQTLIDGETGLLFHTPADLRARLLRLVAVPEDGRALAEAAREYVTRHRMLAQQVQPRIDYYRALWAVRHELTRALYQRVPQLAPASSIAEVEASEINLFA